MKETLRQSKHLCFTRGPRLGDWDKKLSFHSSNPSHPIIRSCKHVSVYVDLCMHVYIYHVPLHIYIDIYIFIIYVLLLLLSNYHIYIHISLHIISMNCGLIICQPLGRPLLRAARRWTPKSPCRTWTVASAAPASSTAARHAPPKVRIQLGGGANWVRVGIT